MRKISGLAFCLTLLSAPALGHPATMAAQAIAIRLESASAGKRSLVNAGIRHRQNARLKMSLRDRKTPRRKVRLSAH